MKYDISDIIKLCNENPMTATWQIIDLSTGKVYPVTGFSGSPGTIAFSYTEPEDGKPKSTTSKDVVFEPDALYLHIWDYKTLSFFLKDGKPEYCF